MFDVSDAKYLASAGAMIGARQIASRRAPVGAAPAWLPRMCIERTQAGIGSGECPTGLLGAPPQHPPTGRGAEEY
jgi:hypothetical protein